MRGGRNGATASLVVTIEIHCDFIYGENLGGELQYDKLYAWSNRHMRSCG
jgi:hypothetical protein